MGERHRGGKDEKDQALGRRKTEPKAHPDSGKGGRACSSGF